MNKERIVLLGSRGQIGNELTKLLRFSGRNIWAYNSEYVDYTNPSMLREVIDDIKPKIIINCVAYTNVVKAEETDGEKEAAVLNIQLAKNLTDIAVRHSADLIHFSTDYVFDGKKNEYYETDRVNPLNRYGLTKSIGEKFTLEYDKSKVFRVQSVYSDRNSNFFKAINAKAEQGLPVTVVDDQYTAPTSAAWIAEQVSKVIDIPSYGLYHLTPNKFCSFADFAELIVNGRVPVIRAHMKSMESVVNRPMVTIMNHDKFDKAFHPITDTWEDVYYKFITKITK